jgi:hypothetical protein
LYFSGLFIPHTNDPAKAGSFTGTLSLPALPGIARWLVVTRAQPFAAKLSFSSNIEVAPCCSMVETRLSDSR